MTPEELYGHVARRPFAPFRIRLAEHATYDIRNPDLIRVGRTMAFVGIVNNSASEFFDLPAWFELKHVTTIELIPTPG